MHLIVPLLVAETYQTTHRRTDSSTSLQWPKTCQGAEQESLREPASNRPTTAIEAMIEGSRAVIASSPPIYRRRVQESGLDRLIIDSAPLAPKTILTASIEPVAAKKGKVRASLVRATAFIVRLAACACLDRTTWGIRIHRRRMQPAWELIELGENQLLLVLATQIIEVALKNLTRTRAQGHKSTRQISPRLGERDKASVTVRRDRRALRMARCCRNQQLLRAQHLPVEALGLTPVRARDSIAP